MNPVSFFSSPLLNGLAWATLLAIPPAIVLLYFLKLKRHPLVVPSTFLWTRTLEDLHVNSIWQRLRKNLLLFLQLLLLLLILIACLQPGWQSSELSGDRFVFLVDTSASMNARDVEPTRLDEAKQQVLAMIDQMRSGDVAMLISFSDVPQVEQPYTDNRRLLRERVRAIRPTNRRSDLNDALRAAAGLANPGLSRLQGEQLVEEAMPATVYILSDGGFRTIPDFSLGNLEPQYVPIGTAEPRNIAIGAFTIERNAEKADQLQAFARLDNFATEPTRVAVQLLLDGSLIDASEVQVPAEGSAGVQFDLREVERGVLQLQLASNDDALPLDDVAYAVINRPRETRVLLITAGDDALRLALSTEETQKIGDVSLADPAILETPEYRREAAAGAYDLIIYDQCVPAEMPQANTWFIGRVPPLNDWSGGEMQGPPLIIDTDRSHPLMQQVELGDVDIVSGFPVTPPAGGSVLIDADIGALLAVAPREGFEDVVQGFPIIAVDEQGGAMPNTNWPIRLSFPVFVKNMIGYFGGAYAEAAGAGVQPGEPMLLRSTQSTNELQVLAPSGESSPVMREGPNSFVFTRTEQLGVYEVRAGDEEPQQRFAVNLFDRRESNLTPQAEIQIRHETVAGQAGVEPVRRDLWKWLVLLGLGVLLFEWYVYNKRVFVW